MGRQQKNKEKLSIFLERLTERMARLSLQQNELAERMGLKAGAVGNWLTGQNAISPKNLRKLAEVLQCDRDWLRGMEGAEPGAKGHGSAGGLKQACHEYLDRLLQRHSGAHELSWFYIELQKRFPLGPGKAEETATGEAAVPQEDLNALEEMHGHLKAGVEKHKGHSASGSGGNE